MATRTPTSSFVRRAAVVSEASDQLFVARQVPIEGLHSMKLDSRRPVIAMLAGLEDLGLLEPRALGVGVGVEFTFLDTDYRATGRRVHDNAFPGGFVKPSSDPCLVVITENKDSAILVPAPRCDSCSGRRQGSYWVCRLSWSNDPDAKEDRRVPGPDVCARLRICRSEHRGVECQEG